MPSSLLTSKATSFEPPFDKPGLFFALPSLLTVRGVLQRPFTRGSVALREGR